MKLLNLIRSNEAISTYNRKYKYTIFEPKELVCLSCNWTKFSRSSSASCCFWLALTFYRIQPICFCMENRTELVQPVSAAHTFDPAIYLSYLHVIFPALAEFIFRTFGCPLVMNICFYCLLSLHFVIF
jgi:hypothetical protein